MKNFTDVVNKLAPTLGVTAVRNPRHTAGGATRRDWAYNRKQRPGPVIIIKPEAYKG